MNVPSALGEFLRLHVPRPPKWQPPREQRLLLAAADGARSLGPAPASGVLFGRPPLFWDDPDAAGCYLWVIDATGVRYVRESPLPALDGELPKHTNLTGGEAASVGGGLWFDSGGNGAKLHLSGGSGRYPPDSAAQLDDAVRVFEELGYTVVSLGWDDGTGAAKRYLE